MKLKDIYLGSTDAKNELLANSPEEIERFKKLYVVPPALLIDKYFTNDKYFISGLKGTGKTALLRYIALKLDESDNVNSKFVLFKSEVDEDSRKELSRASRFGIEEVLENSADYETSDYEAVWRWFIYKTISKAINDSDLDIFQDTPALSSFHAIVNAEVNVKSKSGFMRLIPSIKKGNVEISHSPKLNLDLNWGEDGVAKISFSKLVKNIDDVFEELIPSVARLNIFFDELELNHSTSKQYQRDSLLIRDLIVVIEKINAAAKRKGFNLCLYAAIRSEVMNSVVALGKEINKPLTDFGTDIFWNRPGVTSAQQPLLHIVEQRINNARVENGLSSLDGASLWKEYFPNSIHNKIPQTYLLHNSWYRPRDIVRLLISAQESYPEETKFSTQSLEAIRKRYSQLSWIEMSEELKAKYKSTEIEAIKTIFYGYKQISTLQEFSEHCDSLKALYPEVVELFKNHTIMNLLKDLFRIGVIGNFNKPNPGEQGKMRWSFRGDESILPNQKIYVHNALLAHFSI
ncbi:hypothetical protein QCD67_08360 [Enterobacter roggenkampii]|uniref:P-loop ATPase, Sll1717 family n=1 Tax=Enterobacter roggenkampii TaxID=1812935 RepID=UPI001F30937E|nr:hypothetical protein [Enterobacter roggenkampii]EKS6941456.1 hypothetical protein [Enterobacter roggenkampii]WGG57218.1 hypothetical protein QCD67_08360 [Enterobacter roggenkampii]